MIHHQKQTQMESTMTNPVMTYHTNGEIKTITYCNDKGNRHNVSGPAYIWYYDNGQKRYEQYFKDGKLHNVSGPAVIKYSKNGQIKYEIYYKDGRWHNVSGPAIIEYFDNGQKEYVSYFKDGKRHNVSGPALIQYSDNGQKRYEAYWVENKNVDGHKLIKHLGINPDYTLWTDDEKDMFALHLMLEVS